MAGCLPVPKVQVVAHKASCDAAAEDIQTNLTDGQKNLASLCCTEKFPREVPFVKSLLKLIGWILISVILVLLIFRFGFMGIALSVLVLRILGIKPEPPKKLTPEEKIRAMNEQALKDAKAAKSFTEIYNDSVNISPDEWRTLSIEELQKIQRNRSLMSDRYKRLSRGAQRMVTTNTGYNPKIRRAF